jgi:ubiquinone/menaquinone biosynthesis C-methylase UbiE
MERKMTGQAQWQITAPAAELYERIVARHILGPWAPLLVDSAQVSPGERVLDVACGTGVVTRAAAARVGLSGRVTGVDLNAGMIAVARTHTEPAGATIDWLQRDAADLRLADASYDVVLCQQGLQFFPDKLQALREMRRVLRIDGRLALSVWNSVGLYNAAVGNALSRLLSEETAQLFCASRQFPSGEEIVRLAGKAGFSKINLRVARLNIHLPPLDRFALDHLAATPVASLVAAADEQIQLNIGSSVRAQLHEYDDGWGVTYPEEVCLLTAHVL